MTLIASHGEELGSAANSTQQAAPLGIDATLEHRAAVLVMPLYFGDRVLGLVDLTWGAYNPFHYEELREVISAGVYARMRR